MSDYDWFRDHAMLLVFDLGVDAALATAKDYEQRAPVMGKRAEYYDAALGASRWCRALRSHRTPLGLNGRSNALAKEVIR